MKKIRDLFDKYDADDNEKISIQSYKELLHEFFNWIE